MRFRSLFVLAGVAALGAFLGLGAGAVYRELTHESPTSAKDEELRMALELSLKETGVGELFPDVPLERLDNGTPLLARDVLPQGGVILYLAAACGSCQETMGKLRDMASRQESPETPLLVVITGDPHPIREQGVWPQSKFVVTIDSAQVLADQYGLTIFPSYFWLDGDQVVTKIEVCAGGVDAVIDRLM